MNAPVRAALLAAALLGLVPTAGAAGAQADSARARAARDGWPDTPAGLMACGWVSAFSAGDKAMTAFLEAHVPDSAMAARPLEERMERYRSLRERYGDLLLKSIEASEPHELTAVLVADDAQSHRFIFRVEDRPPHGLVMVGILRHGPGHGHGHGRRPHGR